MFSIILGEKYRSTIRGGISSLVERESYFLDENDAGKAAEMIVAGYNVGVARLRGGVDDGVGHRQMNIDAHAGGGKCKYLVERYKNISQGVRTEAISDRLATIQQKLFVDFVHNNGGHDERGFSLNVGRKARRVYVGGDVLEPAGRIDDDVFRSGRCGHDSRRAISYLWRCRRAL